MNDTATLVSRLLEPLGTDRFQVAFYKTCREIFGNDQCTVFTFADPRAPACLMSDATDPDMQKLTTDLAGHYVAAGFSKDPTLRRLQGEGGRHADGNTCLVCAQAIEDRGYRRRFFEEGAVRQKISTYQHVGKISYYLSLYRNPDQSDFDVSEQAALRDIGGVLCRFLAKQHLLTTCPSEDLVPTTSLSPKFRDDLEERVFSALLSEDAALTDREAEVCASIALGKSTLAISLDKGISVNTVATHRKRAYAKLGICSQNELFARYYKSLTREIRGAQPAWN